MKFSGISNASLSECNECANEILLANRLMDQFDQASLGELQGNNFAFLPFGGREVMRELALLDSLLPASDLKLVVLELAAAAKLPDHLALQRFEAGWAHFPNNVAFYNGGFNGRYIVWLDNISSFVLFDVSDFSGIAVRKDHKIFTYDLLEKKLTDFETWARQITSERDREYYLSLSKHYWKQI